MLLKVTTPRYLLPKRTYMVTRRCSQRQFLLKPGPLVDQVFLYCLGHAAKLFRIEVHAFIVLSNHYHLIVSDLDQTPRLPEFMHWLNLHVSKALNLHYGRAENLWASCPYSAVYLADEEAVISKIVYTITNAVAAGLVGNLGDWPGLCSQPGALARQSYSAARPKLFFRDALPAKVSFRLTRPPSFKEMSRERFRALVTRRVRKRLLMLKDKRGAKKVKGRKAILAEDPTASPGRRPPNRGLSPHIACKNTFLRISFLRLLAAFRADYREAWRQWRSGDHSAVFPEGTYLMRRLHRVHCSTGPPLAA